MVLIISAAVLAAWTPRLASRQYQPRHHSPRLNFLDDYKAEVNSGVAKDRGFDSPAAEDPNAQQFIGEVNSEHMEELQQVALVKGTEDGVDWGVEYLASVEVIAVDDRGMLLQEVLCSAVDHRCINVHVPISWPPNMPIRMGTCTAMQMCAAFTEISRRAYAAALGEDQLLPPEYQRQQDELNGLMSLVNADFGKLLRFYALKHAREALSPTEQVEQAKLTQLTYEGLSLEVKTLDVGGYSLEFGDQVRRQTWSTSILFVQSCQSAYEVENMLYFMFDNTAAAVEEGRINVEDVAPEPVEEMMRNAQKEQEQADARTVAFRERDQRLRRAVRARRYAFAQRATARYIEVSRRWGPTSSSAGD